MRYSELTRPLPLLGVNRIDAAQMVGGETILEELMAKELVKPCHRRHKLTLFDVGDLRAGWEKWKTLDQCPDHSEGA